MCKKINFFRRFFTPLNELEIYYCERRKSNFKKGIVLKCVKERKLIHPLFRVLLRADRWFRRQTITVIGKRKMPTQVILACTHISQNDLENIYESINHHCWWFVGDPCVLYKQFSGLLISLNGSIFLETNDKEDRNIAYLRAIELLKKGGSLMIFPEGARNGFESLPVMPLFSGTSKMALETGSPIVPIAIEEYNKHFIINFGDTILPQNFTNSDELTHTLRNSLATLKWEIWEREGIDSRNNISDDYREKFHKEFEKHIFPYDSLATIERTRFHTSEEIEQNAVNTHLEKMVLSKNNAFLLRNNPYIRR